MSLPTQLAAALGAGFTLIREIGGGGMSRVFLARDEALGRDVVVKSPRPLDVVAPSVPGSLAAVVMKCLEKDPERRPASASAIVEALADPAMLASARPSTAVR